MAPSRSKETIFFIHIPKAGGTSVRHAALKQFPAERVLMMYGSRSQWTSPAAAILVKRRHPEGRAAVISNFIVRRRIAFFASHYPAAQLSCFNPRRAFTILREPVERALSHYFFLRRKKVISMTLDEFVDDPAHQNMQARLLEGVELEALAVVGILECYPEFVDRLNQRLGLHFEVVHRKRGGLPKDLWVRTVGRRMRRRIETANELDADLYERARRLDADLRPHHGDAGIVAEHPVLS